MLCVRDRALECREAGQEENTAERPKNDKFARAQCEGWS